MELIDIDINRLILNEEETGEIYDRYGIDLIPALFVYFQQFGIGSLKDEKCIKKYIKSVMKSLIDYSLNNSKRWKFQEKDVNGIHIDITCGNLDELNLSDYEMINFLNLMINDKNARNFIKDWLKKDYLENDLDLDNLHNVAIEEAEENLKKDGLFTDFIMWKETVNARSEPKILTIKSLQDLIDTAFGENNNDDNCGTGRIIEIWKEKNENGLKVEISYKFEEFKVFDYYLYFIPLEKWKKLTETK